ncbi:MAG: VCBS repeat-containing protein [Polyangiales bacterium]
MLDVVDATATDRPDVIDVATTDAPDVSMLDVVDATASDRPDVIDAPDVVDAGVCEPSVGARPVSPLSGARTTTRDLVFRWALPPGATGARLDFCENRACTPVSRTETVTGTSLRTGVAGRRWWRVQALQGSAPCGPVSPTWWVMPDARTGEGQPYRVLTDLNGDAVTDAFLSGQNAASGAGRLFVHIGNPTTGLPPTPAQTLSSPVGGNGQSGAPAAGDFNGDGFTDVAVWQTNASNQYLGQVWSFLSNGAQITTAPTALTPPTPASSHFGTFMFPGDFNGDGYTDLAVAAGMLDVGGGDIDDPQGGRIAVYPGSATGLVATAATVIASPGGAGSQFGNSGAVVDLNHDGYDDLLANLYVGSSRVWVHLRGGPAGLQRATPDIAALAGTALSGGGPSNLGDVTGDGRVDVGTVANVAGTWRVLVGSGSDGANSLPTEGFTIALTDSPSNGNRLVSADLTGDGVSDLVLTQVVGGEARIYAYESSRTAATYLTHVAPFAGQPGYDGPITVGDYNGDAVFDVLAGHPSFSSNRGAFSVVLGTTRGFVSSMNGRGVTAMDPTANLGNRIAARPLGRTTRRL